MVDLHCKTLKSTGDLIAAKLRHMIKIMLSFVLRTLEMTCTGSADGHAVAIPGPAAGRD